MSKTPFPIFSRNTIKNLDFSIENNGFLTIWFDSIAYSGEESEFVSHFRLTPNMLGDILNGESDLWYEISKYAKKQVIV